MKKFFLILISAVFTFSTSKAQLVSETRDSLMKIIDYIEERLPMTTENTTIDSLIYTDGHMYIYNTVDEAETTVAECLDDIKQNLKNNISVSVAASKTSSVFYNLLINSYTDIKIMLIGKKSKNIMELPVSVNELESIVYDDVKDVSKNVVNRFIQEINKFLPAKLEDGISFSKITLEDRYVVMWYVSELGPIFLEGIKGYINNDPHAIDDMINEVNADKGYADKMLRTSVKAAGYGVRYRYLDKETSKFVDLDLKPEMFNERINTQIINL